MENLIEAPAPPLTSALELWNEASGTYQIDYRWWNVQRIVADILKGLEEGGDHA